MGVVDFFDKLSYDKRCLCFLQKKIYIIECENLRVEKAIGNGEVETGNGKNQELSLIRVVDTRCNSHYKTILRLIDMLPSVIKVLEYVENEEIMVLHKIKLVCEDMFSTMKTIKSDLQNQIGEDFLNSCIICAIDKEAHANVKDEDVMNHQEHLEGFALGPWIPTVKQGGNDLRLVRSKISTFYLYKDIYLHVKDQDPAFLIRQKGEKESKES
ncbi:zinc finger MYM-type protein 1-like protein [Tanacetum coccineum]